VVDGEEPRYLRRQKPVEIKRRKFGGREWRGYFRGFVLAVVCLAAALTLAFAVRFAFFSPRFLLLHPSQVSVTGNHYVPTASILEIFTADRGRSTLRIPLGQRRLEIEQIPWIQQAVVRRTLPDRLSVEVRERTPVAWLRVGAALFLIDADGAILERPAQGAFHFPVVTGLSAEMPQADRSQRVRLLLDFLQQIDLARAGSSDLVSEVDLSDGADVRVTFARLADVDPGAAEDPRQAGAVVVEFGDRDFQEKFRTLLQNVGQWRATVGRIMAVDMRFGKEAVVNPQAAALPSAGAPEGGAPVAGPQP
jgi:cell division protein FtsQ